MTLFTSSIRRISFKNITIMTAILMAVSISFASDQQIKPQRILKGKADLRVALSGDPAIKSQPAPLAAIRTLWIDVSNAGPVAAKDFYVDLYIARNIPSGAFSRRTTSRQLLKDGRLLIKQLRGNGSTRLGFPVRERIPKGISAGDYVIAAYVDSTRAVSELNERNNIAYLRVHLDQMMMNTISPDYHYGGPDWLVLEIEGIGFGSSQGTKSVMVGAEEMTILEWTAAKIRGYVTLGQVNLGYTYSIRIFDNATSTPVSNQVPFKFFSRIYLLEPKEASAGAEVRVWVADRPINQGTVKVKIGSAEAPVVHWPSGEAIHITVPSLSPGQYEIFLEDSGKVISNKFQFFTVL